jgi:hypothetical protein
VSERISALEPKRSSSPRASARAAGADDEFDKVFDDLFESPDKSGSARPSRGR